MAMSKLEILEDIAANGHRKVKWNVGGKNLSLVIDGSSASAMLLIAKNLSPENSVKYMALPWDKMAAFAWKHVSFKRSA